MSVSQLQLVWIYVSFPENLSKAVWHGGRVWEGGGGRGRREGVERGGGEGGRVEKNEEDGVGGKRKEEGVRRMGGGGREE